VAKSVISGKTNLAIKDMLCVFADAGIHDKVLFYQASIALEAPESHPDKCHMFRGLNVKILYAYAMAGIADDELFNELRSQIKRCNARNFHPHSLAITLASYAKLKHSHPGLFSDASKRVLRSQNH
jgi:hypothetical protein